MFKPLFVLLALVSTPVSASWITVQKDGLSYLMPPVECRIGSLPPYTVEVVPQADLDMSLPNRTANMHLFGIHATVNGEAIIYISSALPHRPPVFQDTLIHEQAHLRGCEHGDLWGG